ncbi:MAG: beta-galactosidase [Verrucomicrobia bacterium]|nr:beta-galactosidase [Verrucomicrobiota bacterium]
MNPSRRAFIKWSAGAAALAAVKPFSLWADTANPFAGFGLTAVGKLKTRPSSAIKASPLSVGYETLDRQHFDPVKTYQHAAQLGVKWARCQTGWARTEKTRGQYDFAWLDEVVDGLLKIGIQPWFNLGYGNPLYTPKADATAVGWVPVFDEVAMDGWKNFTAKIAEHFKGRVRHYEIWNEPNITAFWKPGKPDAAAYAKLVKDTAPIIRQRVPDAVIIGCAFARVPLDYLKKCLDAGLAEHVDVVSYHPYREVPEAGYEEDVRGVRELLVQHNGSRIKLWQGECGCPSQKGGAGALSKTDWNETRQAKWLLRRIVSDLRMEVELTSYFLIVDLVGYRGSTNWKGLLRGSDYTPKPAFFAYQNLCALFDAETRKADLQVKVEGAGDAAVVTASFQRRGQPLYLFWTPADLTKDVPPQKVTVTVGDKLKSPALLDPLSGRVYRITKFDALPLTDYPLVIADKTAFQTGN